MKKILLFLTLLIVSVSGTAATTWYVSPNGCNNAACGSVTSPFKTLSYAVASGNTAGGDTIALFAGTYPETQAVIIPYSKPGMTITNYLGGQVTVTIDQVNATQPNYWTGSAIVINQAANTTIHGIIFDGKNTASMAVNNQSAGITITGISASGSSATLTMTSDPSATFTVGKSLIIAPNYTTAPPITGINSVVVAPGTVNTTSIIIPGTFTGTTCSGSCGIAYNDGGTYFTFRDNKVMNMQQNGIYSTAIGWLKIIGNEFFNTANAASNINNPFRKFTPSANNGGWGDGIGITNPGTQYSTFATNNIVTYNYVHDLYGDGIDLFATRNAFVAYNIVKNTFSNGIYMNCMQDSTFFGNTAMFTNTNPSGPISSVGPGIYGGSNRSYAYSFSNENACDTWATANGASNAARNNAFVNNIAYNGDINMYSIWYGDTANKTVYQGMLWANNTIIDGYVKLWSSTPTAGAFGSNPTNIINNLFYRTDASVSSSDLRQVFFQATSGMVYNNASAPVVTWNYNYYYPFTSTQQTAQLYNTTTGLKGANDVAAATFGSEPLVNLTPLVGPVIQGTTLVGYMDTAFLLPALNSPTLVTTNTIPAFTNNSISICTGGCTGLPFGHIPYGTTPKIPFVLNSVLNW